MEGQESGRYVRNIAVACRPAEGRVTVRGELPDALEYPAVELTVLSREGGALASTLIVDAPPQFQMTLHLRSDAAVGARLRLRVEVIKGDETLETAEYDFRFRPP